MRKGVDTIISPRASHAIVKGRITERAAYRFAIAAFVARGRSSGSYLVALRGWPIVALGLVGLVGGYTLHGAAVPVQVPRRSGCRSCSC